MKCLLSSLLFVLLAAGADPPLRLHPDNPHYFLFRGKPTVLITSGEHYGAVLNGRFDYRKYLDTLAAAYAANGQFDEAVHWQSQAVELAEEAEKEDYRRRLALYEAGQPCREE